MKYKRTATKTKEVFDESNKNNVNAISRINVVVVLENLPKIKIIAPRDVT